MGVVLDSSVLIAAEREGDPVGRFLERVHARLSGQPKLGLSAIGLSELMHGVHRARNSAIRAQRDSLIRELLASVEVYPFTGDAAFIAGRIDAEAQMRGERIPLADLLIGATALSLGYSVLTLNERHFRMIPALDVLGLSGAD